mmetsp:Transcript_38120/g.58151  ORF Transcript_38120/g.58151 Transcript_38120/m.58151 type:complete len:85 (-) Transcript_38120:880-1134(-)
MVMKGIKFLLVLRLLGYHIYLRKFLGVGSYDMVLEKKKLKELKKKFKASDISGEEYATQKQEVVEARRKKLSEKMDSKVMIRVD